MSLEEAEASMRAARERDQRVPLGLVPKSIKDAALEAAASKVRS
jgi:hypothetical protein